MSNTLLGGAVIFVLLLVACNAGSNLAASSARSSSGASSSGSTTAAGSGVGSRSTVVAGNSVLVVDGDTFVLRSGERVRVLGIDSCEMSSDHGPDAKSAAFSFLSGSQLTLSTEPGVDRDQYGRLLRYVSTNEGDMGEHMVTGTHTAVYAGQSDASPDRLRRLQAEDGNGRTCDEPEYSPAPEPDGDPGPRDEPDSSRDDDSGSSSSERRRSGNSGHPCLPGERDGDGDGYCGEG